MENGPNILDLVIMAIMAIFLIRALVRGFVREIMGLVGVVVAIFLSETSHKPLADLLSNLTGMQTGWWDAIAYGLIMVLVFAVFVYLGAGLSRLIHSGPFSSLDRLIGGATGLVKGALICFMLLNLLVLAKPDYVRPLMESSLVTPYVQKTGNLVVGLIPESWTQKIKDSSSILKNSLSKQGQEEAPAQESSADKPQ